MLGNFACFFCCLPIFQNIFKKLFGEYRTIRILNSLNLDQDRHCVGPDLGPNCLQRLSADNTSMQRVDKKYTYRFWTGRFSLERNEKKTL